MPSSRGVARALLLLAALGTAACSIDNVTGGEGPAAGSVPDTVAVGVVHRVHQDGHLSLELTATRAETWNDEKQTILSDTHFTEFNQDGTAATEGQARKVVFHSDTENADISGGVKVRSNVEKGDVSADSLSWDNKARRLTAPALEVVTLVKDDGTSISGTGFLGDFRSRELTFSGPVTGTYVSSDEQ
jgi:LPS export ABC transporter protein LptC